MKSCFTVKPVFATTFDYRTDNTQLPVGWLEDCLDCLQESVLKLKIQLTTNNIIFEKYNR